ncbi:MAG: hypothetical protein IJM64_09435 [Ottowia sp.]|nr:hypothetical protein [Ottowia sp.]
MKGRTWTRLHIPYPPPAPIKGARHFLKLFPLAALLAAGAAQAQVTSFSIAGVDSSATACADVNLLLKLEGACASTTCYATGSRATITQGANTGTENDWGVPSYPYDGPMELFSSYDSYAGAITGAKDLEPTQPFTVTVTVEDNGKTFSDTKTISGCINPTIVASGSDAGSGNTVGGGGDNSSPTLGELGLLLSGIALAGAAAPALRRRERKARKQD